MSRGAPQPSTGGTEPEPKLYESVSYNFTQFPKGSIYLHTFTERTPDGDSGLRDKRGYDMRIKSTLLQDERYFVPVNAMASPDPKTKSSPSNPAEHTARTCSFFACHVGGDCPYVANPKYRPIPPPTSSRDELEQAYALGLNGVDPDNAEPELAALKAALQAREQRLCLEAQREELMHTRHPSNADGRWDDWKDDRIKAIDNQLTKLGEKG